MSKLAAFLANDEGMELGEYKMENNFIRISERKPCLFTIDYAVGGHAHKDFVRNISEHGLYIETPFSSDFVPGNDITAVINIHRGEPIKIIGEIRWVEKNGLGIRFKPTDQVRKLKSLLNAL